MKKTRNTIQRAKILQYLRGVQTHPTAEQVYTEIKEDIPTITLATVYRNLNLLAEEGQVIRLEINKEYHYDADISQHQHCVCQKCGVIRDLFEEKVSRRALSKINIKDFFLRAVIIIFFGHCRQCKIKETKIKGAKQNGNLLSK